MKLLVFLLFTAVSFGQSWFTVQIDSNATASGEINIKSTFINSVSVDTPWTTANLTFQKWDDAKNKWFTVKDNSGNIITLTITSPPANYALKPVDAWALKGRIRIISSAAQGDDRVLSYERSRFD